MRPLPHRQFFKTASSSLLLKHAQMSRTNRMHIDQLFVTNTVHHATKPTTLLLLGVMGHSESDTPPGGWGTKLPSSTVNCAPVLALAITAFQAMPPPAPRQAYHSNVAWCHDLWQLHRNEYLSTLLMIAEPPVSFNGLHFEAPWSVWHHLTFPLSRPHRNDSFISAPQSWWLASSPSCRCVQEVRLPAYIFLCSLHTCSSQVRFSSLWKLTTTAEQEE